MRYGRKSRSVRVDGDIQHVLRDLDTGLVRAVGITAANVPEASVTEAIVGDLTCQQVVLRELLPNIDVQIFEQVISAWIQPTSQAPASDPLAVDSKTVRGARTVERDAPYLLSCFTYQSQEVWAEVAVGEKTNEIPKPENCFPPCPLRGASVPLMRCTPTVSCSNSSVPGRRILSL
jgi:hypothetical protein